MLLYLPLHHLSTPPPPPPPLLSIFLFLPVQHVLPLPADGAYRCHCQLPGPSVNPSVQSAMSPKGILPLRLLWIFTVPRGWLLVIEATIWPSERRANNFDFYTRKDFASMCWVTWNLLVPHSCSTRDRDFSMLDALQTLMWCHLQENISISEKS